MREVIIGATSEDVAYKKFKMRYGSIYRRHELYIVRHYGYLWKIEYRPMNY